MTKELLVWEEPEGSVDLDEKGRLHYCLDLEEIKRNLGHDMSTAVREIVKEIDAAALRKVANEAEHKKNKQ